MKRVVVGIGSNVGERLTTMREAVRRIAEVAELVACSPLYETAPVGDVPQSDFLNAAVLLRWAGEPIALLDALLAIERALGRVRDVRWGPRTIDLDVLWIEGEVSTDPRLLVPHPHLHERAFALRPMLDLVPTAIDPRSGSPFSLPPGEVRATDLSLDCDLV